MLVTPSGPLALWGHESQYEPASLLPSTVESKLPKSGRSGVSGVYPCIPVMITPLRGASTGVAFEQFFFFQHLLARHFRQFSGPHAQRHQVRRRRMRRPRARRLRRRSGAKPCVRLFEAELQFQRLDFLRSRKSTFAGSSPPAHPTTPTTPISQA